MQRSGTRRLQDEVFRQRSLTGTDLNHGILGTKLQGRDDLPDDVVILKEVLAEMFLGGDQWGEK